MATTNDYLNQLKKDKQDLVDNLNAKGVSSFEDETFTSLVPKVLDIQGKYQEKVASAKEDSETVISPDSSYDALSKVTINKITSSAISNLIPENIKRGETILDITGTYGATSQVKSVVPSTTSQVIKPDEGIEFLSAVNISAVTKSIDLNIQPENIKSGVSILGVEGNLDNVYKPRAILFTNYKGTDLNYELENLSTENMTSMEDMFKRCSNMTTIDVSRFNTNKVTTLFNMFAECSKLESADISNFNTQNITNMANMFSYCSNLTSITFGKINTSKVTNMAGLFLSCSVLPKVDVSMFDTSNVMMTSNMFNGCRAMTEIDVSNFNVEKVALMNDMFRYCSALTRLDLSSFTTTKVTNNSTMLDSCRALTTLIIDNPNLFKMTNSNMLKSTPIESGTGYVYVPDDMVETYKSATNWSVYANQIKGISELPQEV